MKIYHFNKEKHKTGLQMELAKLEDTPAFDFSSETHCTDFFEIMIFHKGNGSILLDSQNIEITNGAFLFISPLQKRRWFVDKDEIRGYFLIFEQDFLNEFFSDKLFIYRLQYFYNRNVKTCFIPKKRLFSYRHDIFDEIFDEIQNHQNDSEHLLRSILYYMLIKMNRAFCEFHELEHDTQLNNHAYLFKQALESSIREKQRVIDYSLQLGISRISLNSAVKKQFGLTTIKMIKERLIFEIKSELLYSTKTIAEIAYDLNFSEPQHLIRFFKRLTKQTPAKYRKTYQIGNSFV